MNVLITSAGRRVSLVRAFQKELKKLSPKGLVFATDVKPELSAACHVADKAIKVPLLNHITYIESLLSLCLEHEIKMVIPTIDTELLLLAQNKDRFMENGITLVISSENLVKKCRDKRKIHDFFTEHQITIAKEYPKNDYQLPLFIKPCDGSRSVDTFWIQEEKELKPFHFENPKFMFLEYLDHKLHDEFTCDLYYDKLNNLKCVVPRKRLEIRDGEVYKALTLNNELVSYIQQRIGYLEGAVGCLTAQFFKHQSSQKIYGIEINPRFGGGYPLSYLAGANFPKWLLLEYLYDEPIEDAFEVWESNLLMIRYDDEILVHGYQGE